MLSIVFWNLQKRPRSEIVGRMARERAADLVILTECDEDDDLMLQSLRDATGKQFRNVDDLSEKVRVFSCLPISMVRPYSNSACGRISIQRIVLAKTEFLLVAVHLVSKLNRTDSDQLSDAIELSTQIKTAEKYFNHQQSVLVGDLNMNPFDKGMVNASALHGVMTRRIADKRPREVGRIEHPFFYNPMWGLMGDRTPGPSGTHYCLLGRPTEYFWNTFDQILIRPDLCYAFEDDLQVLTKIEETNLLTINGLPDKNVGSDHLPLVFRLNLE